MDKLIANFLFRLSYLLSVSFISIFAFSAYSAHAQSFFLPTIETPKLLGFYDLRMSNRCLGDGTNTEDPRPHSSDILKVIGGAGINVSALTHGKRETLNLFSSAPHIVRVPSRTNIGEGRSNWFTLQTEEVNHPKLVTITARAQEGGVIDYDRMIVYPKISLSEINVSPVKTAYRAGDIVTISGKLTYPYPFGQNQILLRHPYASIAGTTERVQMGGAIWDMARLFGSSSLIHAIEEGDKEFAFEFEINWPEDERIQDLDEVYFATSVNLLPEAFCNVYGRSSFNLGLRVQNPKTYTIQGPIKPAPKRIFK